MSACFSNPYFMYLAAIVICLASVLMLVIMLMTDILLDPSFVAGVKSYSLVKTQLAIWILIVFCSWVYVFGNNLPKEPGGIGRTSLLLLGISCSVTLIGKLIDRRDVQTVSEVRLTHKPQDAGKQNFWKNVISYGDGIGLHRLQYVAINLFLVIAFVSAIIRKVTMPELDCNLLILLCVSSAYYLGAKFKENK